MLGLLHRFHRIGIQFDLQSEMSEDIVFPRARKNSRKEGKSAYVSHALNDCTDSKILEAVERAHIQAKAAVEKLGMLDLLKKHGKCDIMECQQDLNLAEDGSDDDYNDDDNNENNAEGANETDTNADSLVSSLVQEVCSEDSSNIASDISALSALVDSEVKGTLHKLQKSLLLKQLPSSTISVFASNSNPVGQDSTVDNVPICSGKRTYKITPKGKDFSPFVQVQASNQRTVYIRKTTAVWLLQEGERVSSDQLFRVRSKQPYVSQSSNLTLSRNIDGNPQVSTSVSLGDLCAFKDGEKWRIGRVLYNLQNAQRNPVSTHNSTKDTLLTH